MRHLDQSRGSLCAPLIWAMALASFYSAVVRSDPTLVDVVVVLPFPDDGTPAAEKDTLFATSSATALQSFSGPGVSVARSSVFWYNGGALLVSTFLPGSSSAATTLATKFVDSAPTSSSLKAELSTAYSSAYGTPYDRFVFGQCDYSTTFPASQPSRAPADAQDCGSDLSITVVTTTTFTSNSALALCGAIGESLDCSKVSFAASSPVAGQPATTVTIPTGTSSSMAVLASLIAALRNNLNVRAISIRQLSVNGVTVYTTATPAPAPKVVTCQDRLKWLIFLLLIIPLFAVVARFTFRKGVYRGQEVARKEDRTAHEKINRLQTAAASTRGLPAVLRSSSMQPSNDGTRSQSQNMYAYPQQQGYGFSSAVQPGINANPPPSGGSQRGVV